MLISSSYIIFSPFSLEILLVSKQRLYQFYQESLVFQYCSSPDGDSGDLTGLPLGGFPELYLNSPTSDP